MVQTASNQPACVGRGGWISKHAGPASRPSNKYPYRPCEVLAETKRVELEVCLDGDVHYMEGGQLLAFIPWSLQSDRKTFAQLITAIS